MVEYSWHPDWEENIILKNDNIFVIQNETQFKQFNFVEKEIIFLFNINVKIIIYIYVLCIILLSKKLNHNTKTIFIYLKIKTLIKIIKYKIILYINYFIYLLNIFMISHVIKVI